jgi:hypothetical protein
MRLITYWYLHLVNLNQHFDWWFLHELIDMFWDSSVIIWGPSTSLANKYRLCWCSSKFKASAPFAYCKRWLNVAVFRMRPEKAEALCHSKWGACTIKMSPYSTAWLIVFGPSQKRRQMSEWFLRAMKNNRPIESIEYFKNILMFHIIFHEIKQKENKIHILWSSLKHCSVKHLSGSTCRRIFTLQLYV